MMRSTWWEHVYYLSFMVMSWFNFLFCPGWLLNPQAVYGDAAAAALLLTAEQTGIASECEEKIYHFYFNFMICFFSFHLKFLHTNLVLVNVSAPRQNLETHFILLTQTAIEIRACEGKVKIWLIPVFHFFQLERSPITVTMISQSAHWTQYATIILTRQQIENRWQGRWDNVFHSVCKTCFSSLLIYFFN